MTASKLFILATATLAIATVPTIAAPIADFADDQVARDAMSSAGDPAMPAITLVADSFDPLVAFSGLPAAQTPTNIKPTKPSAPVDFGDSDSKPTEPVVEIVPLPAPAGLAVAGLLLIGGIRRR